MKRTALTLITSTLLVASQAPAVFLDTFDTLSPEWEFINVETTSTLIYDVTGGAFQASGFTPGSGGPTRTTWVRRNMFGLGAPGQNSLTLETKMSLPLTENISRVGFSILDIGEFGDERGTREVSFRRLGADYRVSLRAGSISTTVLVMGLVNEVEIELQNNGPTATLFLNGTLVSTVTNHAFFDQNPEYRYVQMNFTGEPGTSTPVNIDYIQVVPEPVSVAGFGIASLLLAGRVRKLELPR